jgi:hypothetical protein
MECLQSIQKLLQKTPKILVLLELTLEMLTLKRRVMKKPKTMQKIFVTALEGHHFG